MKRLGIITLLAAFLIQGFSQDISAEKKEDQKQVAKSNSREDIKVSDRGITLLESLEGKDPGVESGGIRNEELFCDDQDKKDTPSKKRNRFKGHWAGVELGFNNYLTTDHDLSLPVDIDYMSLHSGKSRTFGINAGQLSIGLARHVGFVTGVGLIWNNYRFDGNNNIQKVADQIVILDPGAQLKKSKLATLYLKIPFLLEFQIPTDHNRLNISAGPVGAIKLTSNSVMVFEDDDKVKSDGDFNLNMLRYGATARIGYENFNIFATYYLTPLFKTGKGPGGHDLFPFEIGFAFTIDD